MLMMYDNAVEEVPLVAVATMTQTDPHCAHHTLDKSGINRPQIALCSTGGLLEEPMLKEMIHRVDGGKHHYNLSQNPQQIESVRRIETLVLWCGLGLLARFWEGSVAKNEGVNLNFFQPRNHGVPYGYCSLLVWKGSKKDMLGDTKISWWIRCCIWNSFRWEWSLWYDGKIPRILGRIFPHWIVKEKLMKDHKGKHIEHTSLSSRCSAMSCCESRHNLCVETNKRMVQPLIVWQDRTTLVIVPQSNKTTTF